MRTIQNPKDLNEMNSTEVWSHESLGPVSHKSYHEMEDRPVVEKDALMQLQSNVEMLSDLQGRLSFLMREVRYIMRIEA